MTQLSIGQELSRAKKAAKKGKVAEALQRYNAILLLQPDNPIAKKAISKLQKSIPTGSASQTNNMSPSQQQINVLINLLNTDQLEKAEQACKELLHTFPQALVVLNIMAGVLSQQGKFKESVQTCDRMIQLKPDFAQAYYNRGVVFQKSGKFEDAIKSFSMAIQQKPDYAQAHSDLSLIMLLLGNYKEGWKEHEWRMMEEKNREQVPVAITKWNGESLERNVILVRAEQGIGDEIMFSSCFPDLISLNPEQIIVECDSRLVTLFTRSFPVMSIQGKRKENNLDWLKEFGSIDFQVAMGSLPMFFRPDLDSFPDRQSFLKPDSALLEKWNIRFAELGEGIKVGMSWRGGSKDSMKVSRSIDLNSWMPILQSDAHFVNLQYGDCTEEIEQLERVVRGAYSRLG